MAALSNMTTRQKVTVGVFIVILLIVIWQVMGLFSSSTPTTTITPKSTTAMSNQSPNGMPPAQPAPQPAQLVKQQPPLSPREIELMKLQQETQAKYVEALNELQMLRVTREIAETNQAIMAAKLATVTAQKNIVDILSPPTPTVTPSTYAQGLVAPTSTAPTAPPTGAAPQPTPPATISPPAEVNYTVISVSQLQNKWSAVLGYQGNLYSVSIGDVLPADGSTVISIGRSGVILDKNGARKKISLVPII